ncbi:EI24 domain-containing protein [Saccharopolyspora sp. NPDC002686]|uniref:EI24 domain-containing protein n=1 Tax=Saccharopolyspora sp. NPDC002686 TaxID=3154541 RepID=UPI003333A71A
MSSFLAGSRALGTGFGIIARRPKLLVLGALPALISAALLLGCLGALIYSSGDLVSWMTPFADGWGDVGRRALRILVGIALVGSAALLASVSFIAITLLVGGPFYEHIAEKAEEELGLDTSDDGAGVLRQIGRGVQDSVKLVLIALVGAIALFAIGFIPVAGQIAALVLGALFGAWLVAVEMVGLVFARRGLKLADRRRELRKHRAAVFGFGLPTYLLCLIPVLQLVVIPSAVVGGTLLAHQVLDPARTGARR